MVQENKEMAIDFSSLSDEDLVFAYGNLLTELRDRKIIRSKNVVGDLGEYLAINFYNRTHNLPNLQAAPKGTQNVDALSRDGERYSIKTTTGKVTGVFYGLPPQASTAIPEKKFEHVILVMMNADYALIRINQLSWDDFLKYKRWHSRMNAWNISINKQLLKSTKEIFVNRKIVINL